MQPIADFLKGYSGLTLLGYRSSIFQFFDSRNGNVRKKKDSTPEERERYEELAREYLAGDVKPLVDLKAFKDAQFTMRRPPHSISQNVACVKIWMEHYDHELTAKGLRELKKYMPHQRSGVTREDEVTSQTIRAILSHTGDVRLKAACLIMVSSGIRVGELVRLTLDDIDLKKRTIYISDLISKTGESRITFFTEESAIALQEYLTEMGKYYDRAIQRSSRLSRKYVTRNNELFPYETSTFRKGFIATLKKAGLYRVDGRTHRTTIHLHSFRKYFNSELKMAGCPDDVVEQLMGHSGYLASSYRRYSESQLRELYRKYESALIIGTDDSVKATVSAIAEKAEQQNGIIKEQEKTIAELQDRLKQVERNAEILKATKARAHADPEYKKLLARVEALEATQK